MSDKYLVEKPQNWWLWIKEQFNCSECDALHFAIYAIMGLVLGVLLRSFGRQLILLSLAIICSIFLLNYTHLIEINFNTLNHHLGIPQTSSLTDFINYYAQWAKDHVAFCIIFFVGFLVGMRLR